MKPKKVPIVNKSNLVNYIMDFEGGNMSVASYLSLFSYLIKTKQAYSLQGNYGRTAESLIRRGLINRDGTINWSIVKRPERMLYEE